MKVVLINGKYGSGKDTFADLVAKNVKNYGKRPLRIAFANLVKYYLKEYYNYDGNKTPEGRALMQHFATDMVRTKDPTFWADIVARFIRNVSDDFDIAIVSDLRFENEVEAIYNYCGFNNTILVKIERNLSDSNDATRAHISENELNNYVFNYIIDNNSTLEVLSECAEAFAAEICAN